MKPYLFTLKLRDIHQLLLIPRKCCGKIHFQAAITFVLDKEDQCLGICFKLKWKEMISSPVLPNPNKLKALISHKTQEYSIIIVCQPILLK